MSSALSSALSWISSELMAKYLKGKEEEHGAGRLQALQRPIQSSIIRLSFSPYAFYHGPRMALPIVRPSSEMQQEKEVLCMKYLSSLNASGPSGKSIKAAV